MFSSTVFYLISRVYYNINIAFLRNDFSIYISLFYSNDLFQFLTLLFSQQFVDINVRVSHLSNIFQNYIVYYCYLVILLFFRN